MRHFDINHTNDNTFSIIFIDKIYYLFHIVIVLGRNFHCWNDHITIKANIEVSELFFNRKKCY